MTPTTHSIPVAGLGDIPVTVTDEGNGLPVLLLHGGGGIRTVADFGARLVSSGPGNRVLVPTHPGFEGTDRPEGLTSVPGLASLYVGLLDALDLHDVLVVGNSLGGWIAAEMAVLGSPRVRGYLLVDAVGAEVEGHPVVDFFSLTLPEVADYSYYEPDKWRIDPSALPPAVLQAMAGNRAALETYAGREMVDPTLLARLSTVPTPTLVVWGEADRIADPGYGQALAAAIPGARFELLTETGHLPQMETPEKLEATLRQFAGEVTTSQL